MEEQKQEKYLVKVEPLPGKEDQFDVTELRGGQPVTASLSSHMDRKNHVA